MHSLREQFEWGMDRELPELLEPPLDGEERWHQGTLVRPRFNLGAGKKLIPDTIPLDAERNWWAGDALPAEPGSVEAVYAYHFFEHLAKEEIIETLKEIERVLMVGGILNTVTPHWDSEAAHQDLDHKSFWSESTWRNLFENPYYEGTMPRNWRLKVRSCAIMGLVQRNLVIVSQIVKV